MKNGNKCITLSCVSAKHKLPIKAEKALKNQDFFVGADEGI